MADQGDISVGAGVGFWDYKEQDGFNFSPLSLEAGVDYGLLTNLDLRVNIGLGISEEIEILSGGNELTFSIDHYINIYLKPKLSIENLSMYPLIGYSTTRFDATYNNHSISDTANGFSYGIGASYSFSNSSEITFEWRQQADTDDYELSGFSIGFLADI